MIGLRLDLGYLQEHYLESSQTTCESSQPGVKSQHVSQIESTTSDVIRAMTWHRLCGTNTPYRSTRHSTTGITRGDSEKIYFDTWVQEGTMGARG